MGLIALRHVGSSPTNPPALAVPLFYFLPRQLSFQIWAQDGLPAAVKRPSDPRHSLMPLALSHHQFPQTRGSRPGAPANTPPWFPRALPRGTLAPWTSLISSDPQSVSN